MTGPVATSSAAKAPSRTDRCRLPWKHRSDRSEKKLNVIYRRLKVGASRPRGPWPFLVLLLAVLVSTACVLWFMSRAAGNERLAVRQRLTEVYRGQLSIVQSRLDEYWRGKLETLGQVQSTAGPGQAFAQLVHGGVCDSAIVLDPTGNVEYPRPPRPPQRRTLPRQWEQAWQLEYTLGDAFAAAVVYAQLARQSEDIHLATGALQSQARCLLKAGKRAEALAVLTGPLADARYDGATDADGRLIVPNARLLVLELLAGAAAPADREQYRATVTALRDRLNDYAGPPMPTGQRLFLMHRLSTGPAGVGPFATQPAEILAERYTAGWAGRPRTPGLHQTHLSGVWSLAAGGGRIVALFRDDRIGEEMRPLLHADPPLVGAAVGLLRPDGADAGRPFLAVPASGHLPGWQVALTLTGRDPFAAVARRQVAVYLWTGTLVVAAIVILAGLVARSIGRQMKLTRLKNDLIATVSHELKTPLASIRVLVDTLVEGRAGGPQQADEYMQLIARENDRLCRLIDNFLTFSRMERNKRAFEFDDVAIPDVVQTAIRAAGERLSSDDCRLDVDVADDLPTVRADRDALITVGLNLLDNAWKYTGQSKRISLRAYSDAGWVCLEVADNGIGLSRRAMRKVFNRFYQVDRSLSRPAGGCGLGLSM